MNILRICLLKGSDRLIEPLCRAIADICTDVVSRNVFVSLPGSSEGDSPPTSPPPCRSPACPGLIEILNLEQTRSHANTAVQVCRAIDATCFGDVIWSDFVLVNESAIGTTLLTSLMLPLCRVPSLPISLLTRIK
jgi:hypothetical protein